MQAMIAGGSGWDLVQRFGNESADGRHELFDAFVNVPDAFVGLADAFGILPEAFFMLGPIFGLVAQHLALLGLQVRHDNERVFQLFVGGLELTQPCFEFGHSS